VDKTAMFYAGISLAAVFVSSVSQVMLKKAEMRKYPSKLREYFNPLVICAYAMFLGTTFLSMYALKGISLSMGAVLEATGYLWVTFWGVTIFREKLTRKKALALLLIVCGILVYSLFE